MLQVGNIFAPPAKHPVKQIAAAISNTFVILCRPPNPTLFSKVVHLKSDGSIVHMYVFQATKDPFFMVSSHQVLMVSRSGASIILIDLVEKEQKRFSIEFQDAKRGQFYLKWFYFRETDVTCLCETAIIDSVKHVKMNYFRGRQYDQPILVNVIKRIQASFFGFSTDFTKANEHSLIIVQSREHHWTQSIVLFDILFDHQSQKITLRRRPFVINLKIRLSSFIGHQITVNYWQYVEKQLLLVATIKKEVKLSTKVFILHLEKQEMKPLPCEWPVRFQPQKLFFVEDLICIWKYSSRTFGHSNLMFPYLCLINPQSGAVLLKILLKEHQWNYAELSDYESSLLMISSLDAYKPSTKAQKIRVLSRRQMYMQMIFHLNDDFDDDLLLDALELLNVDNENHWA